MIKEIRKLLRMADKCIQQTHKQLENRGKCDFLLKNI